MLDWRRDSPLPDDMAVLCLLFQKCSKTRATRSRTPTEKVLARVREFTWRLDFLRIVPMTIPAICPGRRVYVIGALFSEYVALDGSHLVAVVDEVMVDTVEVENVEGSSISVVGNVVGAVVGSVVGTEGKTGVGIVAGVVVRVVVGAVVGPVTGTITCTVVGAVVASTGNGGIDVVSTGTGMIITSGEGVSITAVDDTVKIDSEIVGTSEVLGGN